MEWYFLRSVCIHSKLGVTNSAAQFFRAVAYGKSRLPPLLCTHDTAVVHGVSSYCSSVQKKASGNTPCRFFNPSGVVVGVQLW